MLSIRWIRPTDLPEIYQLEKLVFVSGWRAKHFLDRLAARPLYRGVVARLNGDVVGYLIVRATSSGAAITSIAVHPNVRRNGIACYMLLKAGSSLSLSVLDRWTALVPETAVAAQHWLRACDFKCTKIVKRVGQPDLYRFVRDKTIPRINAKHNNDTARRDDGLDSDAGSGDHKTASD